MCSLLTPAECSFAFCQWEEELWQGDLLQRKEFKSNLLSPARQSCPDDKGPNGRLYKSHTLSALSSFVIYLFLFQRFIESRSQRCSDNSRPEVNMWQDTGVLYIFTNTSIWQWKRGDYGLTYIGLEQQYWVSISTSEPPQSQITLISKIFLLWCWGLTPKSISLFFPAILTFRVPGWC